ncbi:MAG: VacJ family lipoprotein [Magnetococcales bacterium]|nr:VacJ family lipoprotein [Magnetococcales bacterium]
MRNLLLTIMALVFLCLPSLADAQGDGSRNPDRGVVAAASGDVKDLAEPAPVSDPLEPWNRFIYTINDIFYHGLLKPVSILYSFILPEPVRIAVGHFFHNLAMPKHFLSALLQGKLDVAGRELSRFGINTILGGLGFFDVAATHFNLKSGEEDIGQTLGTYGMGDALFIEWPILGPSNLRDTLGLAGDTLLNPLSYYPSNVWTRAEIFGVKVVNHTSLRIGEYEDLKKAAIDPYVALRDAYLQMRREQIRQ